MVACTGGSTARGDDTKHAMEQTAPAQRQELQVAELLREIDATLLAVICSALSAQSLLRLEVALGASTGRELQGSAGYRAAWMQLLAREAGLVLAQSHKACAEEMPVSTSKAVLRGVYASSSLDGGWRGFVSTAALQRSTVALSKLHVQHPDGRELLDLETGESWGRVRRLALVHFDVCGCFENTAWDTLVESFCKDRGVPPHTPHCVRSSCASCTVGGLPLHLSLVLRSLPLGRGAQDGFVVDLDMESFNDYFGLEACGTAQHSLHDRQQDLIHVACIFRCGEIERQSACIIRTRCVHGPRFLLPVDQRHLWHFTAFRRGFAQVFRLEVYTGEDRSRPANGSEKRESLVFCIEENLSTAQWNPGLPHGTDLVPLIWAKACTPANEFAAKPFPERSLEGAIALIRRGGGCGFAHKAITARDAGAVGCIIYEGKGDREAMGDVFSMGQRFGAQDYPDPGIPSVMVDATDGRRVIEAVQALGGARARIVLDNSVNALRALNADFQAFREEAKLGEPVHLAVLVERVKTPTCEEDLGTPRLDWFNALDPPGPPWPGRNRRNPDNESLVQLAMVHVL
mmetsp:Transcript_49741/g.88407  ORF Transcript_49741/g.88407 Transcript_49741/m.88407 type:complete len:573 (-) Transcript_49741:62-1780(-)